MELHKELKRQQLDGAAVVLQFKGNEFGVPRHDSRKSSIQAQQRLHGRAAHALVLVLDTLKHQHHILLHFLGWQSVERVGPGLPLVGLEVENYTAATGLQIGHRLHRVHRVDGEVTATVASPTETGLWNDYPYYM